MTSREMPKYQCLKQVRALKIKEVVTVKKPGDFNFMHIPHIGPGLITPEDERYAPFEVTMEYMLKHKPEAGGYYVVYVDGYESYSPAEAFENGYILIPA